MADIYPAAIGPLIFKRNRYLKGTLHTVKVKSFDADDVNPAGISRADWRLVHLQGDQMFMDSLYPLPEDHLFSLGVSGTMIRGGQRICAKKKDLTKEQGLAIQALITPP